MNYYGKTDKGVHRDFNEDFLDGFEHEGILFLMVGDGQGSQRGGVTASTVAIEEIKRYIIEVYKRGMEHQLEMVLKRAYYVAHRVIEGVRKGDPGRYNGFCTSLTLVALKQDKTMVFAHVGNTKFFVYREGELIQMTTDHTETQKLVEQRKITIEEARIHPERAILTKAIGVFPRIEPIVTAGRVAQGDILLLVSDGITEHVTLPEITQIVNAAGNIQTTCDYLIQAANERGGYDNITVVASYINF